MSYQWRVISSEPALSVGDVVTTILRNRNFFDTSSFFDHILPKPSFFSDQILSDFSTLLLSAIKNNEPIVIHGDYDVDGVCATAILWELVYYGFGYKNVFPFFPDRFNDGYGLTLKSLEKISQKIGSGNPGLLITVDCGISSLDPVKQAQSRGFKVIVTDHHQIPENAAQPDLLVWSDRFCGAAIAWLLAQSAGKLPLEWGLDLACLATVADVIPLINANRALVKEGLSYLSNTSRVGLQALFDLCSLSAPFSVYDVGWVIAPRLNAAGRLEGALDSLRLLCTKNKEQASYLAFNLDNLNKERQDITRKAVSYAKSTIDSDAIPSVLITDHDSYHEGVLGLIAGRLVKEYYRPAVVISLTKGGLAKGSARSIGPFNIVKALGELKDFLIGFGGHPMAAGFSLPSSNLPSFKTGLLALGDSLLKEEDLLPILDIDMVISQSLLDWELFEALCSLEPFGHGNPEPSFLVKGQIQDIRLMGSKNDHLKIRLVDDFGKISPEIVGFGLGGFFQQLGLGKGIEVVFNLRENQWQGQRRLQLNALDIKIA